MQQDLSLLAAEHQLIGFNMGVSGTLKELLNGMALRKEEWEAIKKYNKHLMLDENIIMEVDLYFT